jgi:hypothetical protein
VSNTFSFSPRGGFFFKLTCFYTSIIVEQKKLLINQANRELEEADEIVRRIIIIFSSSNLIHMLSIRTLFYSQCVPPQQISQMEMEITSLPQGTKAKLSPRVKQFKDDIRKAKRDLVRSCFFLFFFFLPFCFYRSFAWFLTSIVQN